MAYNAISYFALFLPAVMIVYSLAPKKYRWIVLLLAGYAFFWTWSEKVMLFNIASALFTWVVGKKLESMRKVPKDADRKAYKKQRKKILAFGIVINILVLIALKYTNFLGASVYGLAGLKWKKLPILVPIGISYYTLQAVSYLADIVSGKIHAENNPFKLMLYLSFFPILVEGPISRYSEISEDLYAGHDISYENLTSGYQRILWGLFKKMCVADYFAITTEVLFAKHTGTGSLALTAAVFYTIQLYCDFAGTIDVVIGSAKVFGVVLPENFRQPFFAKNAGEFWRRWHMTLGAFLRDYIFYPVSLAKPVMNITRAAKKKGHAWTAKFIGPVIALFFVWITNGFWHGPYWSYVLYGVYYFVIMVLETLLKDPFEHLCDRLHISRESKGFRVFLFVKLLIIVISGELLFGAPDAATAGKMYKAIFVNFNFAKWKAEINMLGLGRIKYAIAFFSFGIVVIADILHEKGIYITEKMKKMPAPVRWALWYAAIFFVILFGAYGPGYTAEAMMYAGF